MSVIIMYWSSEKGQGLFILLTLFSFSKEKRLIILLQLVYLLKTEETTKPSLSGGTLPKG